MWPPRAMVGERFSMRALTVEVARAASAEPPIGPGPRAGPDRSIMIGGRPVSGARVRSEVRYCSSDDDGSSRRG